MERKKENSSLLVYGKREGEQFCTFQEAMIESKSVQLYYSFPVQVFEWSHYVSDLNRLFYVPHSNMKSQKHTGYL